MENKYVVPIRTKLFKMVINQLNKPSGVTFHHKFLYRNEGYKALMGVYNYIVKYGKPNYGVVSFEKGRVSLFCSHYLNYLFDIVLNNEDLSFDYSQTDILLFKQALLSVAKDLEMDHLYIASIGDEQLQNILVAD